MAYYYSQSVARRLEVALISSRNILPLFAGIAHLLNRYIASFDCFLPYGFSHYQLGDLCGGIIFPAYVNTLSEAVCGKTLINGLPSSLILSTGCSLCWEVLAPALFDFSTPDMLDACMYFIGGILYLVAFKLGSTDRAQPAPSNYLSDTTEWTECKAGQKR